MGADPGPTRAVPAEDRRIREGDWQHTIGTGLSGRTLGLVGLGRLGTQVANLVRAFGMDTIAWSQHLTAETAEVAGVNAVGKRELFATADVISVHVRLSDRTRGLVGAEEIGLMSRDAYPVNTSRCGRDVSPGPESTCSSASRCPPTIRG